MFHIISQKYDAKGLVAYRIKPDSLKIFILGKKHPPFL